MKYSQRLHRALILAAFALLFVVIGSAYCQIDSETIGAEKSVYIVSRNDTVWAQSDTGNVLLWPAVDIARSSWCFQDTLKGDTIPTPVWNTIVMDSATAKWYYGTGTITIDATGTFTPLPRTITFTDSLNKEVLKIVPNGDIFWRGRLVTTDSMLVHGLRDIIDGRR